MDLILANWAARAATSACDSLFSSRPSSLAMFVSCAPLWSMMEVISFSRLEVGSNLELSEAVVTGATFSTSFVNLNCLAVRFLTTWPLHLDISLAAFLYETILSILFAVSVPTGAGVAFFCARRFSAFFACSARSSFPRAPVASEMETT